MGQEKFSEIFQGELCRIYFKKVKDLYIRQD